jgi:BirA family biotin operon repressor/biotin-[acetyl-CoA-carboxylase] ligase
MIHVHLEACDSTQDEVRARLTSVDPGSVVAVSADSQRAGRGREGRAWQDPPGAGLMLSVGRRGPLPLSVLEELPRRVADAVLEAVDAGRRHVVWKAPNDLVSAAGGAKVGGILVDARTTGEQVDQVIVGIGLNVDGPAFTTADGRAATSLAAAGAAVDHVGERLPALVANVLD